MVVRRVYDNDGRCLLEILEALRQGAQGSSACTVRVLASADHDGVCAYKIFEGILHRMGLLFTVVPVAANTDITENFKQLKDDPEVRSLVLLNCGASLNIEDLLVTYEAPAEVQCFVVDAHRPFELANLSKRHTRVIVLDDDEQEEEENLQQRAELAEAKAAEIARMRGEMWEDDPLGTMEDSPSESEDGDSDAEKENHWDPDARAGGAEPRPPRPKQTRTERLAARLERRQQRQAERKAKEKEFKSAIMEYYLVEWVATPVGMSLLKMATKQTVLSQDDLWLASVSLLGYHEQGLIDEATYRRMAVYDLKEALDRTGDTGSSSWCTTQSSGSARGSNAPHSAEDPAGAMGDSNAAAGGAEGGDSSKTAAAGGVSDDDAAPPAKRARRRAGPAGSRKKLRFDHDLRLTLYKHWTVEESVLHSAYFYGTLELHRDKGMRSLRNFFATAGIPPRDYKQIYDTTDVQIRKELRAKFKQHGKAYGLTENRMFMQQFVRDFGRSMGENGLALRLHDISCTDATLIATALLSKVPSGLTRETLPLRPDGQRDLDGITSIERESVMANFWQAVQGVSCADEKCIGDGLEKAVEVAKAVQTMGRLVKDRKEIREAKDFHWCKIEQAPPIFRNPLIVRKFAVWVLHTLFTYRPKGAGAEKPLLVAMRDQVRGSYLCVGVMPMRDAKKGMFGFLFRRAFTSAHRNGGTLNAKYDFFDKSVVEVAADEFDRFWDLMTSNAG